jgi:hypothetical protein
MAFLRLKREGLIINKGGMKRKTIYTIYLVLKDVSKIHPKSLA